MSTHTIYILEDDEDVAELFRETLEDYGFAVEVFGQRAALEHRVGSQEPSLCVVDLGLPDGDGMSLISAVLRDRAIPTIVVTGRGGLSDKVIGLEMGADDYIVKPVEPRELVARIRSVLRRFEGQPTAGAPNGGTIAKFADWSVDFDSCTIVSPRGDISALSAAEAVLLRAFVEAPGRILSRSALLDLKQHSDLDPFDRSIDVRVSRLRKKLDDDPREPKIIKTVYGAGYVFTPKVEWQK